MQNDNKMNQKCKAKPCAKAGYIMIKKTTETRSKFVDTLLAGHIKKK